MASSSLFLDTNGWLALLNKDDALHDLAQERWLELGTQNPWVFLTD